LVTTQKLPKEVNYNETVEPFTVVTAYFENEVIFP
jgi:hypothetical protein